MNPSTQTTARFFSIKGRVQGVGFRPFVSRLAHKFGLVGWVRNAAGQVDIFVQGDPECLADFERALIEQAPPLAKPEPPIARPADCVSLETFTIVGSETGDVRHAHIPPDYFICDDCLAEMHDTAQRRYRYPFINCTQCGPRYTLIERLPYDRPNTSMAGFPLCESCRREYENPLDRRFHAQPLACPICGPSLCFRKEGRAEVTDTEEALEACIEALRAGMTLAVKGVGGYHLLCDATSEAAVVRLRKRKRRPHKPLAVMFPWVGPDVVGAVGECAQASDTELSLLQDPLRPILLVAKRAGGPLAESIAPGMAEVGLMFPYSPLHHLLLEGFGSPVVATSANLSGEPVLTEAAEVEARLAQVADAFLHHDRPIRRPADDAVFRVIAGKPRPLRLGRGCAPLEIGLPFKLDRPVLAVTRMGSCLTFQHFVVLLTREKRHSAEAECPLIAADSSFDEEGPMVLFGSKAIVAKKTLCGEVKTPEKRRCRSDWRPSIGAYPESRDSPVGGGRWPDVKHRLHAKPARACPTTRPQYGNRRARPRSASASRTQTG